MPAGTITRRSLVGAMAAAAAPRHSALAADNPDRFRSGYQVVDDGVRPTLEFLSRIYRLDGDWLPDFSFFDDGDKPNSFAEAPIIGFRRPHVKIGRGSIREAMQVSNGNFGAALTGVFGHEFAHVYQMSKGISKKLLDADAKDSVRLVETHADFLSGWALPQAWWITQVGDLRVAAEQFFALGDIQTNTHGHHGTNLQRQAIMAAGYTWGLSSPNDPDKASERGIAVLKDLFPQWFRST
ncbi:hypothetical protein BB934_45810 (plasmid) [Microvirga ossetica]|uniref:Metalloprotease n=1 Tax=Microvirga ossetica TaxID=1882682 RepID=A0A1B2F026_9HYPH|nr:hypothetical protein [Microvirga ossetica]ANY85538.1 hypothetical protein BB934_45810 [Microvirga ossetica]